MNQSTARGRPGARPIRQDDIRRHNLGRLLGQVHRHGELTRADLTQRLNLSRSTIGALVADLTELGLLDETVPVGGERVGRPSHVVGPRPDGPYAIAVDIDVTHVSTAAVGIGGFVLAIHDVPTGLRSSSPVTIAALIVSACDELAAKVPDGAWPIGIGVSVPGTVTSSDGTVELAPNLGWRDEPFGQLLAGLAPPNLPISVGNDADLAVMAEHMRGAGRGCNDLIYLAGRIGVGAGVIANGAPLRGFMGHAGEVGHNVVDASGPRCHCGRRGCVETYIGDKALLKLAGRRVSPTIAHMTEVFAAAELGDVRAAAAVRTVAVALGQTIGSLVNILNPEKVILGGSLAGVFGFARPELEAALVAHTMMTDREAVELCAPGLGNDSTLLGAAELAFARLFADPLDQSSQS
ncbi:MAG: ROK family transcriptional regulator [Jatrophihabitantaceae bacterium]